MRPIPSIKLIIRINNICQNFHLQNKIEWLTTNNKYIHVSKRESNKYMYKCCGYDVKVGSGIRGTIGNLQVG